MIKYNFKNDYSEGAHQKVMESLVTANTGQYDGYGNDKLTEKAVEVLKKAIGRDDISINFLSGGTQTNLVCIEAFLKAHEAVIAAEIGHINGHECGAIEAIGHKILTVKSEDGKIRPSDIKGILKQHTNEHVVSPKLVYISNAMENGSVYTKKEIYDISKCCKKNGLFLFLDGARLGSALSFLKGDLTLKDISNMVDAFYIGGTKNGTLFGEALIVCNDYTKKHIRYVMKQKGAILAKTWTVAVQFKALFEENLYYELADNANKTAFNLYTGLKEMGIEFYGEFNSNQIFPIFHKDILKKINKKYKYEVWGDFDKNNTIIRLVTSWATTDETVSIFLEDIMKILDKNKSAV